MAEWKDSHDQYLDEWVSFHYGIKRYQEWLPVYTPFPDAGDVLAQEMFDAIEGKVENLEEYLAQIIYYLGQLTLKLNAIEYYMTKSADQMEIYLDSTKVIEIEQINNTNALLITGSTYNDLNNINTATLTDWRIIDSTTSNTLYEYEGTGWDNDSIIIKYISDWDFGKDYLIHPLITFDGTYGIYPNIDVYTKAKNTIEGSKDKISGSEEVLEDYM
jgi:hypothetical protein